MLILTRSINQSIMIGDDITITVLGSKGQVRIGIDAPRAIDVHRSEIYYTIQEEKKQAIKDFNEIKEKVAYFDGEKIRELKIKQPCIAIKSSKLTA